MQNFFGAFRDIWPNRDTEEQQAGGQKLVVWSILTIQVAQVEETVQSYFGK